MLVKQIMSADPASCRSSSPLDQVARMMLAEDCGEIPICDDDGILIGVVTDRDIVCQAVAQGRNPLELRAEDCMSRPVVTVRRETSIDECARLMEAYQVRRLPVVDDAGACCGIVTQADLATRGPRGATLEVVKQVSQPNPFASAVMDKE